MWHNTYPNCDDSSQSPINIDTDEVEEQEHVAFRFYGELDTSDVTMTLENTGRTGLYSVSADFA